MPDRYERVCEALRTCADEKRQRTKETSAEDEARRAFQEATQPRELSSPWPEIAAYRLAHVLMRKAKTADELREVDSYFARAAGAESMQQQPTLGPLPLLYRLAVLRRLSPGCGLSPAIEDAMRSACAAVRQWGTTEREVRINEHLPPVRIQSGNFNMLELAAYFLGSNYGPLQGLGEREDSLFDSLFPQCGGWYVLGKGASGSSILLSHAFAMEHLESLGRANPSAVLMKLPPKRGIQWRVARSPDWIDANDDFVKLLSWILKEPELDRTELTAKLFRAPDDGSVKTSFRKLIERVRKSLQKLTELSSLEVFASTDHFLRLSPELSLFAAVDARTLKSRPVR